MDDAVVEEIELTADDFEPLDYEDATDDSLMLQFSRKQHKITLSLAVVDKVCDPSAHKKAGGPRNDDVSNMGEMRIQDNKRRSNLLRSAKKHYESEVYDVCSDDDMLLELPEDSETESSQSSQVPSPNTLSQKWSLIKDIRQIIALRRKPLWSSLVDVDRTLLYVTKSMNPEPEYRHSQLPGCYQNEKPPIMQYRDACTTRLSY
ncbi:unnamed protein product [Cylicocyclus nassatus]|uniref:Uncharacterized protein n=1 Tax=Cylicocyclus nassatus TaxID=53992 RepID=A0AA36GMW3_CYLNA|nr:unnamed protein product [Cylicocyclus nassatus]